jgi:hypothetical protein
MFDSAGPQKGTVSILVAPSEIMTLREKCFKSQLKAELSSGISACLYAIDG